MDVPYSVVYNTESVDPKFASDLCMLSCRCELCMLGCIHGKHMSNAAVVYRFRSFPFMAQFCRQQLFTYLEHSASLIVAFHYAHTDAARSMLHFDLLLQEDLEQGEDSPAVSPADTAKAQIIQEVCCCLSSSETTCNRLETVMRV